MARFEVFIPAVTPDELNLTLRVTADTWMAALKIGLRKIGQGSMPSDVLCDVKDDESIHVTDPRSGRVFRIAEIPEVSDPGLLPMPPVGNAPAPVRVTATEPAREPQPAARPGPPAPKIEVAPPAPKIEIAPPAPKIEVAPPAPKIEIAPPAPKVEVAPPAPKIEIAPPAPKVEVAPPAPKIEIAPPAPKIAVAPPAPKVEVAPPAPKVEVAPPAPKVDFAPPAPKVEVAPPAPKVEIAPPAPKIAVAPPAPKIDPATRAAPPAPPPPSARERKPESKPAKGKDKPTPVVVVEVKAPRSPPPAQIGRKSDDGSVEEVLIELFERTPAVFQKNKQDALDYLLDLAMEKVPSDSGSVYVADLNRRDLAFASARGPKAKELLELKLRVPMGKGFVGFCAQEGVAMAISDAQRDPRFLRDISDRLGYETKSVLTTPIIAGGRTLGAMQLINKKGSTTFTHAELSILHYLAHQAALYLESRD